MNKTTKKRMTEKLKVEEQRVRNALKADSGDIKELKSEWQEVDSPSERNLRAVEWNQYSSLNEELTEIEDAKQRTNDGTFGICGNCGEEISVRRLENVPTARLCLACQEESEKEKGLYDHKATL